MVTHEGAPLKAAPEATLLEPGWHQPEPPWTPNFHFQATGRDGIAAIGELTIAALAEVFDLGSHDEVSLGFQRRFLEAGHVARSGAVEPGAQAITGDLGC